MSPRRIKATDFYLLTACSRQVYLDYHGDPADRVELSRYQVWLVERGVSFEQQIIKAMSLEPPRIRYDDLDTGFALTVDLMRQGAEMIYQGVLKHDDLVGMPDLLIRTPGPSRWGSYHYRPVDVKSSTAPTLGQRLQVMCYMALLEAIQGMRPEGGLLLKLPAAEITPERLYHEEDVVFDELTFGEHLEQIRALAAGEEPRPFISSVCKDCGWQALCKPVAEQAQDVSLLPGLKRSVWEQLRARRLGTLPALAAARRDVLLNIKGVGEKTADTMIRQARALTHGQAVHIKPPAIEPTGSMIFFDIESVPGENIIYLLGTLVRHASGTAYEYDMAPGIDAEAEMWRRFVQRVELIQGPVYHYGSYERTALRQLAERHGDSERCESLIQRMVDVEKVLKDCVALPLYSYSLKDVAPWLGFAWSGETKAADDSMLEYIAWLADGDSQHIERILRYNQDDCLATAAIYDWLLSLC